MQYVHIQFWVDGLGMMDFGVDDFVSRGLKWSVIFGEDLRKPAWC